MVVVLAWSFVNYWQYQSFLFVDDEMPVLDGMPQSAVGYGMLANLLRAQGIDVTFAPIPEYEFQTTSSLIILAPISPRAIFPVVQSEINGTILLVPPKWTFRHDPQNPRWVRNFDVLDDKRVMASFPTFGFHATFTHRSGYTHLYWHTQPDGMIPFLPTPGFIQDLRNLSSLSRSSSFEPSVRTPQTLPLIWDNAGRVLLAQRGSVLLLSDPDVLNNQGLKDPQTAMPPLP